MTKYYAITNKYGSETSVGFDNTIEARVFFNKAERDKYVNDFQNSNLAVRACTRKEALSYAARNGDALFLLHPFNHTMVKV